MGHISEKRSKRQRTILRLRCLADIEDDDSPLFDPKIRAIGRRAYRRGGREEMIRVFWELYEDGIHVGHNWDGIGGWWR